MARGDEQEWTKASLTAVYRDQTRPELMDRLLEVLDRVDSCGRLLTARRINPAFGIAGNAGHRVLSIREHDGNEIRGNISIFRNHPDGSTEAGEYEALRLQLSPIIVPGTIENRTSWDVASLSDMSDDAFNHFLAVLDWLGPVFPQVPASVPASDAEFQVPSRADTVISRIVRDSAIVRRLKQLHHNRCQICGLRVSGLHGWSYAEAHHVRPLGAPHDGPDVEDNLLILCPNHHAACDFGAIEVDPSELRVEPGHTVRPEHIHYHNSTIVRRPG